MTDQKFVFHPVLKANNTVLEAANYLGVGETTVKQEIKLGRLRSYKNGRRRLIKGEWVLEYEAMLIAESQGKKQTG